MGKKRHGLVVRIAVGLVAVILYGAAYFDSVRGDVGLHLGRGAEGAEIRVSREPRYQFAQPFCKWFFYPMYQIDRSLVRPEFWAPPAPKKQDQKAP